MIPRLLSATNPAQPAPAPAENDLKADLMDRHLQMEPVGGVDRVSLVEKVRHGAPGAVEEALKGVESSFAQRTNKAAVFHKIGGAFQVTGSVLAIGSWIAGGVAGGMRFGFWGAVGGALAGGIGGALIGFSSGMIGDKIWRIAKPPTEAELAAVKDLRTVDQRLAGAPARTEAQRAAARAAAEEARQKGHPTPTTGQPGERPDTDILNGALFGAKDLRVRGTYSLPRQLDLASSVTPDGKLMALTEDRSRLQALEPRTGQEAWGLDLPGGVTWRQVAVSPQGHVAVGGVGKVMLFDSSKQAPIGTWTSGSNQMVNPSFDREGRLLVTGWDGDRPALLLPGRPDAAWTGDNGHYNAELVDGPEGLLYETGSDQPVRARDEATGARRWEAAVGGRFQPGAVSAPDGTLVGVEGSWSNRQFTALEPDYGLRLWTAPAGEEGKAPVVTADGTLLVSASERNKLTALDVATGKPRWTARLEADLHTGPVVAPDGTLVMSDSGGRVYLFDPDRGVALKMAKLEFLSSNLVPLADGDVLAIDGAGKATVLTAEAEAKKDPGKIEEEQEYVIIGGVKVPINR